MWYALWLRNGGLGEFEIYFKMSSCRENSLQVNEILSKQCYDPISKSNFMPAPVVMKQRQPNIKPPNTGIWGIIFFMFMPSMLALSIACVCRVLAA